MKQEETILKVSGLNCQTGKRYLLRNINWEVKRGEQWVVFGLNGSGKTTLLSIIAGFKEKTGGKIEVFGEEYTNTNILNLRKKIGWVSSSFFDKYYRKESALAIVLSGLSGTLGITENISDDDVLHAKELLKEWYVEDKADLPFSMLSKGERQNILIARAMISEPEILVLDEPATGLDVLKREYLLQKINYLAKEKKITMIYVTHYPEEIQPIFTKCLMLREGKIADIGLTKEIMQTERMTHNLQSDVVIKTSTDGRINLQVM